MFKNVAGQKVTLIAIDTATNTPKTGDAANITAYVSIDGGAVTVLADTSAAEMDATNAPGDYQFSLAQGETNGDSLRYSGKSSTSGVKIVPVTFTTKSSTGDADLAAILADTNELQTDLTNGGRLDLLIDDILADTNEVQTDLTNGGRLDLLIDSIKAKTDGLPADTAASLAAIAGYIDTEIATLVANVATIVGLIDTEIAAILADTNEMQTDLTNGGRLDLLIDAIKAKTDTISDIYLGQIDAQLYEEDEDRYTIAWTKNGEPITSGITDPLISVRKWSDGTLLVNAQTMTEIGTTEGFKWAEPTNRMGNNEAALVICTATIDGSTRTARHPIKKPVNAG